MSASRLGDVALNLLSLGRTRSTVARTSGFGRTVQTMVGVGGVHGLAQRGARERRSTEGGGLLR